MNVILFNVVTNEYCSCYIVFNANFDIIGLLFYRLYKTYRNVPSVALSKLQLLHSWYGTLQPVLILAASIMYAWDPIGIGGQLYSMSSICVIILAIALFGVYIYKMYSITKASKDDLLNIIAKNSLLAIFSISITFLASIFLHFWKQSIQQSILLLLLLLSLQIFIQMLCAYFYHIKLLMLIIIGFVDIVIQNVSGNV